MQTVSEDGTKLGPSEIGEILVQTPVDIKVFRLDLTFMDNTSNSWFAYL